MNTSIVSEEIINKLKNNAVNKGYIIGKANKMYTLYTYDISNIFDDKLVRETLVTFKFNKILSKNIDKVKALYPNSEICETLHCNFTISKGDGLTEKRIQSKTYNFFKYGKYTSMEFDICRDLPYMCWYYNNTNFDTMDHGDEFKTYLVKRLNEMNAIGYMGNYYSEYNDYLIKIKKLYDTKIAFHESFEWECKCGVDYNGIIPFLDNAVLAFQYVKPTMYGNLPQSEDTMKEYDGPAKRIKNKTILVTDYEIDPTNKMRYSSYGNNQYKTRATFVILIKSFKVLKK